ncbi:STAS domain-containing protein [Inquilinus sp.]|jgi:anti-anti-sigma factor|uniref:STAS domain-containing protein n=1 Tax=Inquilinus sp. TaxID=1932117 RepID=UPI0037836352
MAEFTVRDRGRLTILDVTGEISGSGEGYERLDRAVLKAVDGGGTILLNLSGVTAMDSAGADALYQARIYADRQGLDVKVASIPPKLRDFLQAELPHFEIYDTEDAAVAAHGGDASA